MQPIDYVLTDDIGEDMWLPLSDDAYLCLRFALCWRYFAFCMAEPEP